MTYLSRTIAEKRKRIVAVIIVWLEMCSIISWFLTLMMAASSLSIYRPKFKSYFLDFYAKREYVKCLVHDNDESCISQFRMNRIAFFKLCEMLKNIESFRPIRNMAIDEQVAMFLHIIFHHLKNRVIR